MGQRLSGFSATQENTRKRGFDSAAEYAELLDSYLGGSGHCKKNRGVLLSFVSPSCGLCSSLNGVLEDIQRRNTIDIVKIDSSKVDVWGLELLRYKIETVPCFVLLDCKGNAVGKTVEFSDKQAVEQALETLIGGGK